MTLIQFISDRFFIYNNILNLSRSPSILIKEKCKKRLKEYPFNYAALYILALFGYYSKNLEMAYDYYKQLTENHRVKKTIHKWFIKNLISYQLYYRNLNELTRKRCIELLQYIENKKIKIILLKHLCIALDRLNEYEQLLETCLDLRKNGFYDLNVIAYEEKAKSLLKKKNI